MKERVCRVCGKPFLDDSPGRKYCSPECARRAANEKKREYTRRKNEELRKAGKFIHTCEVCGAQFESPRSDRRFCSVRCARAQFRKEPTRNYGEGKCAVCGKLFLRASHNSVYCSPECVKIGRARVSKASKQRRRCKVDRPLSNDSLHDVVLMAAEAGMSYGKYVAMRGI